jgi:hypothetical protein
VEVHDALTKGSEDDIYLFVDNGGMTSDLRDKADAFAARLPPTPSTFSEDFQAFDRELSALVDIVRGLDSQFAFDLEGRPAALTAIRAALPGMERELLDAVLDDHEAEVAAWKEALYQGMIAYGRALRSG